MISPTASRCVLVVAGLMVASCSSTRPLPKYEKPMPHSQHQTVRTTAYTHTESDHVQYGQRSALGDTLQSGAIKSAAADWSRWPAGTLFRIDETGELYQVDDYGWALAGTNTIDLYKPSRSAMNDWGVRRVHIEIQRWGSPSKSESVLSGRSGYAHVRRMLTGLRNDHQPYAALSSPTPTEPLATISSAPAVATPASTFVSVRKPFLP
jgi:3D (Asp-Asp-Asp) domain-containing protein